MSKGIGGHHSAASRTNEWITPPEIIQQLGEFDLDPCSPVIRPWPTARIHYTIDDDGLRKEWNGRVWMNPPYSRDLIPNWMKRLSDHGNGIALVFARTDTDWFYNYVFPTADSIFFLKRRIHFCNIAGQRAKDDGGAPSVFIAYGEENSEAIAKAKFIGRHVPLNYTPMIVVGVSPTWISVVSIAVRNSSDQELKVVYDMVERIAPDKVARNKFWKEKVRQQIQVLRKKKHEQ